METMETMQTTEVVWVSDGCLYWMTVQGLPGLWQVYERIPSDALIKTVNGKVI